MSFPPQHVVKQWRLQAWIVYSVLVGVAFFYTSYHAYSIYATRESPPTDVTEDYSDLGTFGDIALCPTGPSKPAFGEVGSFWFLEGRPELRIHAQGIGYSRNPCIVISLSKNHITGKHSMDYPHVEWAVSFEYHGGNRGQIMGKESAVSLYSIPHDERSSDNSMTKALMQDAGSFAWLGMIPTCQPGQESCQKAYVMVEKIRRINPDANWPYGEAREDIRIDSLTFASMEQPYLPKQRFTSGSPISNISDYKSSRLRVVQMHFGMLKMSIQVITRRGLWYRYTNLIGKASGYFALVSFVFFSVYRRRNPRSSDDSALTLLTKGADDEPVEFDT